MPCNLGHRIVEHSPALQLSSDAVDCTDAGTVKIDSAMNAGTNVRRTQTASGRGRDGQDRRERCKH